MKLLIHIILILICTPALAAEIHVAPQGNDANPGSADQPFRTLEKARDTLRLIRATDPTTHTIFLHAGAYPIVSPITFTQADSGSPAAPVVLRSQPGERVRLIGGRTLAAADFRPVTDTALLRAIRSEAQGKIVSLDLKSLGIQHAGPWGDVVKEGRADLLELFVGGRRLPLAQYPNEGFMTMARVLENGDTKTARPGVFEYRDPRHADWTDAVRRGLWLKGFWRVPWQSEYVRVASIDPARKIVTHTQPVAGGIGSKYRRPQGSGEEPYLAVNLIEEIDTPGEWCIDFPSKTLFIWPPDGFAASGLLLSDHSEPLIRLQNASCITIRGIALEGRLGNGIEIVGGEDCVVTGCLLTNLGANGIVIRGGLRHTIRDCDLHDLGAGGIYADGGNTKLLTPASHLIANNHIWRFARVKTVYAPAISLGAYSGQATRPDCVGIVVRNNLIHDTPHVGITYAGANHLLELNEIHHVALVSNDMGGFYTWNDWTSRGNILRHNFIHGSPQAEGIYCDDGDSGDTITGNVFFGLSNGAFIGGGHDNIVTGNIAIDCRKAGYHIDARGAKRGYNTQNKTMVDAVQSKNHKQPPWSVAFPEMINILENHPELPTGTRITGNAAINCKKNVNIQAKPDEIQFSKVENNTEGVLPELDTPDAVRAFIRNPPPAAEPLLRGIESIPIDRIGLVNTPDREALATLRGEQ